MPYTHQRGATNVALNFLANKLRRGTGLIMSFKVKKQKQTSCTREILSLSGTENYENFFLCVFIKRTC